MNNTRILSVAIAETPVIPSVPAIPPILILAAGTLLAVIASLGLAFALEYLDPSFRTPREVMEELNIPVLATVSHKRPVEVGPFDHVASGSGLNS
jgi:capsular polysaccharide biosynthesis protein